MRLDFNFSMHKMLIFPQGQFLKFQNWAFLEVRRFIINFTHFVAFAFGELKSSQTDFLDHFWTLLDMT